MNTTTVVLAAVIFAWAGTLIFAAIAPSLSSECSRHRKNMPQAKSR